MRRIITWTLTASLALVLAGCETTSTDKDIIIEQVNPLDGAGWNIQRRATMLLRARRTADEETGAQDVFLPLTWTVELPHLGQITSQAGRDAVYTSTAALGANVVRVRDQAGREGIVIITTVPPEASSD